MQVNGPGIEPGSVYDAIGGDATFERLAAGFYEEVKDDDILGPMYPAEDMDGAQRRLKMFLAQYWGGPSDYSEQRGHPRLRMRHAQFPVNRAAAERWLELMGAALDRIDETTIPPAYRAMLWEHMERVAAMLINAPDPH